MPCFRAIFGVRVFSCFHWDFLILAAKHVSDESSEEDEEECVEQEAYFSAIRADERPASPVREAIAIHPGDPTHREEAHFPVLHQSVDQTESTHRTDIVDDTD